MCLAIPGKITKIEKDLATVDYDGETRVASIALKKDVKIGDYVIVNAKFIMQIIPEEEAKKAIKVWNLTDEA
jgi:hydrogenase expression/formation protein HypC